jgi:hypothetical protein
MLLLMMGVLARLYRLHWDSERHSETLYHFWEHSVAIVYQLLL